MDNEPRALLIEWDQSTGKRSGNIPANDPNLRCKGWQNLDVTPELELRLVLDDRDLTKPPYANTPGVTVIIGKVAINGAITSNFPAKTSIDLALMLAGAKEIGVPLSTFKGLTRSEVADKALELGLPGVISRPTRLLD